MEGSSNDLLLFLIPDFLPLEPGSCFRRCIGDHLAISPSNSPSARVAWFKLRSLGGVLDNPESAKVTNLRPVGEIRHLRQLEFCQTFKIQLNSQES